MYALRGPSDRATATFAEAIRLMPGTASLPSGLALVQLWSGDRAGWRKSCAGLLDRFRGTFDPSTAATVAWACASGPGATDDPDTPVRLAETAVKHSADSTSAPFYLTTLGAVLFRAGQFEEAIRRLEQRAQVRGGKSPPEVWAFQAMVHHRLGHRDEALRWLELLRNYHPNSDPASARNELEIRLLRGDAASAAGGGSRGTRCGARDRGTAGSAEDFDHGGVPHARCPGRFARGIHFPSGGSR